MNSHFKTLLQTDWSDTGEKLYHTANDALCCAIAPEGLSLRYMCPKYPYLLPYFPYSPSPIKLTIPVNVRSMGRR